VAAKRRKNNDKRPDGEPPTLNNEHSTLNARKPEGVGRARVLSEWGGFFNRWFDVDQKMGGWRRVAAKRCRN
jgi:hypothetical protein